MNVIYGENKQTIRDRAFSLVRANFHANKNLQVLSFPSIQGVKLNSSFEKKIKKTYKRSVLDGLECNPKIYNKIKNNDFINIANERDIDFFRLYEGLNLSYDSIWLDLFDGFNKKNLQTWEVLVNSELLKEDSLLMLTLCNSPRIRKTKSYKKIKSFHRKIEKGLEMFFNVKSKKYHFSLIDNVQYKNSDINSHAQPMLFLAFKVVYL